VDRVLKKSKSPRNYALERLIREQNRLFVERCLADGLGGDGLLFANGDTLVSSRARPGEAKARKCGYYPS